MFVAPYRRAPWLGLASAGAQRSNADEAGSGEVSFAALAVMAAGVLIGTTLMTARMSPRADADPSQVSTVATDVCRG